MRKKIVLLLSFVLAFAMSLAVLVGISGCKKDDGQTVTVNISRTTLTVETNKTSKLTATASDGSELVWSTSNAEVATVDAGTVTGVSAGTATITATVKGGTANASCEVTVKDPVVFTFKDAEGAVITKVNVDRNGDPVQISASASDGSAITLWSSMDEAIASVSSTGLVTGLKEGETTLSVMTATGSATIPVEVTDSFQGEHYEITDEATEGRWYYWTRTDKGQTWDVSGEKRGDVVTFGYSGGNWDVDSIYLAIKNPQVENGWRRLSMAINSSIETVITVNGTRVNLVKGDNSVSVCYQQTDLASATISFSNGEAGTSPDEMEVVITEVKWEAFTPVDLQIPTFTLDEEGNVAITDPNEEGVKNYEIALFAEGSASAVHNQTFFAKSGKLDTSAVEQNGEYIVRIRAIGNPGFTSTEWSAGNDIKYTINNTDISYTLSTDGTHGSGANVALTSGKWEYWAVTEEGSSCESATYANGTVTLEFMRGWSWYGMQVFRHYANFEAGASLKVTMTITVTGGSGNITVCGTPVAIEDGVPKVVEIPVNQPNNVGQTDIKTTVTVSFGEAGSGQLPSEASIPGYVNLTATLSDISVVEFKPEKLATPTASYTAAAEENPAKIEVTDEANAEEKVSGYQVGFFNAEDKLVGTALIKADGTFSDLAIEDGTYSLKVRAATSGALYENSDWTEAIATGYVIANGGKVEEITSGGEADSTKNPDVWYLWTDVAKFTTKTVTTVSATKEQTISVAYTGNTANWYGVQLFYKNSSLTVGKIYKLTLNINSLTAGTIQMNGKAVELVAGDNAIEVYYTESDAASFSLQCGTASGGGITAGTFTLSNIKWEEYTPVKLATPSIAFDELNFTITDTDNTEADSVASYRISIYDENGKLATSQTVTEKTGTLDVSLLATGTYTVKVTAVGTLLYGNSDESAAVTLNVVNEGGVMYEMPFGQAADDQWGNKGLDVDGKYYYWNDQNWAGATVTMSQKSYDNGTITVGYTVTAGGTDFAVQIFRKSNELTAGSNYTLTFKINVTTATTISVNGAKKTLVAGDNNISVDFTAPTCTQPGGDCEFTLQIHASTTDDTATNTVVISEIVYTPVTE